MHLEFLLGRFVGAILGIGVLFLIGYLLYLYGQTFKVMGLMRMPVTWADSNQNVYEVYIKGQLEMGCFVTLMENVEYIGKEMVYGNRLEL